MKKNIKIGDIVFGEDQPFVLIAGPCVIESRDMIMRLAEEIKNITDELNIPFIFKASYDKANRTSISSFRGPGITEGLDILSEVKDKFKVPVLSDVHSVEEIKQASSVLDVLQIPAFLCRQTDLVVAAGESGKVVNVKKGQFMAPLDMIQVIKKIESTGNENILITERGTSFGYNTLVTDFRGLEIMGKMGYPVVFDATHSVQQPGGLGDTSGGCREYVPLLARCAMAAGCDSVFVEVHPDPEKALSDGPNMLPLTKLRNFLKDLKVMESAFKECHR